MSSEAVNHSWKHHEAELVFRKRDREYKYRKSGNSSFVFLRFFCGCHSILLLIHPGPFSEPRFSTPRLREIYRSPLSRVLAKAGL